MMDYNNTFSTDVYNVTTTSTPIHDDYSLSSYLRFWSFLRLIILVIGIVANIAFMVVLVKEKEKKTSYTVYVGAVVVNDIIFLVETLLYGSLFDLLDYDIEAANTFICKFQNFIFFSVRILNGWLVVLITTERLLHAYFPRMTKLFDRRMPGLIAVFLIVCGILFINLHYILHLDLRDFHLSDGTVIVICDVVILYYGDQYAEYYTLHDQVIIPIIAVIIPGACVIIGNIILMKAFCKSLRAPCATRRISVRDRDMYVFTTMLSVMFLCIDIPVIVFFHYIIHTAFKNVLNILLALNHSLKCFVYILYKKKC